MHIRLTGAIGACLSLLAVPARATEYNIQQQPMAHETGAADGAMWRSVVNDTSTPFSTYGPYLATAAKDGELIVYTTLTLSPAAGASMSVEWDVMDGATTFYRKLLSTNANSPYFMSYALRGPTSNLQVRTRHNANGTLWQSNVFILRERLDRVAVVWPAAEQVRQHGVGSAIGAGDWIAGPGSLGCTSAGCGEASLTYGPGTSLGLTPGDYIALFHLQTNTGAGSSGALFDLRVRYWNAAQQRYVTIGLWTAKGTDFTANNVMTALPVKFTATSAMLDTLDFEVRFVNPSITLRQSATKIFRMQ